MSSSPISTTSVLEVVMLHSDKVVSPKGMGLRGITVEMVKWFPGAKPVLKTNSYSTCCQRAICVCAKYVDIQCVIHTVWIHCLCIRQSVLITVATNVIQDTAARLSFLNILQTVLS